jgi:hypothetical protein
VRGKKNLVISKSLTGPIGLFVRFSTLQEYGVDKVFVLENGNTDSSQRNIVYLIQGEKAAQVQTTAGVYSSFGLHGRKTPLFYDSSSAQLFAISLPLLHRTKPHQSPLFSTSLSW